MSVLARLYGLLLCLFPREFRREFGAEMQATFAEALAGASLSGRWAVVRVCLRELRGLPAVLLALHVESLKRSLRAGQGPHQAEVHMEIETVAAPGSRAEALAAVAPFLAFGTVVTLMALPGSLQGVGNALILPAYAVLLAGLAAGWRRGFPRWSCAYLGLVVLLPLYATSVAIPEPRILGLSLGPRLVLGGWAWLPLLLTLAALILAGHSLRPLQRLLVGITRDWTRLTFALYGAIPLFLTLVSFDEVRDGYEVPYLAAATLALAAGAWVYVRAPRVRRRVLALAAGLAVTAILSSVGTAIYWHGRLEPWMARSASGPRIAASSLFLTALEDLLVFSPALLGLRRPGHRRPA